MKKIVLGHRNQGTGVQPTKAGKESSEAGGPSPQACGTEEWAVLSGLQLWSWAAGGHEVEISLEQISGRANSPGGCPRVGSTQPGSAGRLPGGEMLSGLLSSQSHCSWTWNSPECLRTRPRGPARGHTVTDFHALHPHTGGGSPPPLLSRSFQS